MNTYGLLESLLYGLQCIVEIAVAGLVFWGFWVVLVKMVNAVIGGG